MDTIEIFEKLKNLQTILSRRYELDKKVKTLPDELKQQEATLDTFKVEYVDKAKKYESIKDKVLETRKSLEEVIKTREQGEAGMENVTAHREYELLYKQIEDAKTKETELRKVLEIEERELAHLDEEVKSVKDLIDPQEKDLADARAAIEKQINEATAEIKSLDEKKAQIIPGLDEEILFKFDRIIQRNDEGIVAVHNGVCKGCNMMLPAQFANEVREGVDIKFCPYCSRILYYEDVPEPGEGTFLTGDSNPLALDDDEDLGDEDIDEIEEEEVEGDESLDEDTQDADDLDGDEDAQDLED